MITFPMYFASVFEAQLLIKTPGIRISFQMAG